MSHGNFISACLHLQLLMGLSPKDVHLNLMPLFHVGGLFMAFSGFHAGALNVNMPKFDAPRAAEIIEKHGITVLLDFAPILGAIMEQAEQAGRSLATLGQYNLRPGSAGRVISLARIRLVDDGDKEVATGEVGEITVTGPMVFNRYWNLPEETALAFRKGIDQNRGGKRVSR